MVPRTKIMLQPRVPTLPKKPKTSTMVTSPKKAKSKKSAPPKKFPKKPGCDHDDIQFLKHFADLCQYRAEHGTDRIPRKNTGKNNSLADWVNYIKKKKACGKLPNPHVEALDGIKFEWKLNEWKFDRVPKKTFEEWFAELEEYKSTFNTALFLGKDRKIYKTLAAWTAYVKQVTAIKVLENKGKNSEFTLIHIKKLVDIGVVPRSNYSYGVDGAEDVNNELKIAAIGEETSEAQQTLPIAQSILEVPVKTAQSVSALPHTTAVPTDNVAHLTAVATSNLTQFSTYVLFPRFIS
jgi:hypothetical protein